MMTAMFIYPLFTILPIELAQIIFIITAGRQVKLNRL